MSIGDSKCVLVWTCKLATMLSKLSNSRLQLQATACRKCVLQLQPWQHEHSSSGRLQPAEEGTSTSTTKSHIST